MFSQNMCANISSPKVMQLKCPSSDDGQINKNSSQQNITSNKINRVLPYAITWMNLENINLSEKKKSQSF